ncbi:glycosyltransferase family 4 protein [Desulforhopalus singaporensis]|uniref:Glycosyltransferase involved in cell wall bisynthesis n=1 Tax=Desulforhopalus singaporensis TaxID=91360 RepID=A0A1H0PEQ9_9BACT|nr:glycosyltransferase family 4 protein [Desulforhopalus singaporensis]SDP03106.1 Glycosyltransferase involved in cell wall bisynthesis [Desulforhopalus singaporensis]
MVSRKLKIVQLLPELEEGGVEGETVDLALYLAKQGHESIVISGGGRLVPLLEQGGCHHMEWKYIGEKSFRCLRYIKKLKKFLVEKDIDVLHLRSRLPAWIGYLAWKGLPKHLRPSLVTTFHGFYSVNCYSSIMTRGERVVAVSETIKKHILSHYKVDREKIELIHGGFEESEFAPEKIEQSRTDALRKQWNLPTADKAVIMLPGRFTLWKGQDILIESLTLVKQKRPDFICLLIGNIEEKTGYAKKLGDKVKSHGLTEQVYFVGHCDDMPAALMLADVVVSASSTQPEAFGKVAIEAMAMGRAVIATAHGGSLETVIDGQTGWLIPPMNAVAMADAIIDALSDRKKREEFGRKGRQRVLEKFTARQMCEKTVELYQTSYDERTRPIKKDKVNVMQLLPMLNSGGVERGTLEMGRFLALNNHESQVVSGGGRLVEQLTKEGSIHHTMKIGSKSPISLMQILPLRQKILKNVDILHMRSRVPAWVGYLAWLSIPPGKRPVLVTTFHGFYSVNSYSAIMTKGDGVIAVSDSIKKHIEEQYGRTDRVKRIFRGVEMSSFDPDNIDLQRVARLRRSWGVEPEKPVITLPGRLTRLKGQEVFLKSLCQVNSFDYQALIVGDVESNPGYVEELRQFIDKNNLAGKVKLVGHCGDMPAAFYLSDIVISASSLEPEAFGRTTVEAMAMGCPVIATAHGGSLETVIPGENGWLVKPSDPDELARAIGEALATDRNKLKLIGEKNRARVKSNFTAHAMCEQTLDFYAELLLAKKNIELTC